MTVQTNVNRVSTADPEPEMGRMLWRLAPMIYGPTVLFALGEGAVVPLLPVIAAELGADVPTAALVAAALVVGQLCGNIPAGWAVARVGERVTMAGGGVLALAGVTGLLLAPSLPVLAVNAGARLVVLNAEPTSCDDLADARLDSPIGSVLPLLVTGLADAATPGSE